MKRRSKVLVLIGSVFGFVCIGFLLQKMEHLPVASIGGEMIVDNPSWRNRDIAHEFDTGYLWVTPKTILYRENAAGN